MIINPPVLRADQISEFRAAVRHNEQTFRRQIAAQRLCDQDYYFVSVRDNEYVLHHPGQHNMLMARKVDDYVAGAVTGALPSYDLNGSDGIRIDECGEITEVELKLCMKSGSRFHINVNGRICIINSTGNFRSDCAAHYKIVNNIQKKNVDTFLVVFDKDTWELIDVFKMKGDRIIDLLATNQSSGEDKTSKQRTITLNQFMNLGRRVFQDVLPSIGVEEWEKRIYDRCGRDPAEAEGFWNPSRTLRFTVLWTSGTPIDDIHAEFSCRTKKALQSRAKFLRIYRP